LERDQLILFALCLLLLAAAALRFVTSRWGHFARSHKLAAGQRIDYRVNINTAGIPELDLLPGIGQAKAADIVKYRDTHGPFRRVEDLANVRGVSPGRVEKLRALITVGAATSRGELPR